ncbi:hypothetical protein [Streptomyces soliscabiei]|uniref:hypothetical protein n=1 Tax=Streptomyces soliscabiei TaxID=588897 RepID=UPI0029A9B8A4|nr:hypothetical protein [Streptomyces sp. NY05-11A]MDX2680675.1 hypothetical protein [Streptomyces sp. NY05-11A]
MSTRKLTIERVYLITSLGVFDATPAELATRIRGHWAHADHPAARAPGSVRRGEPPTPAARPEKPLGPRRP